MVIDGMTFNWIVNDRVVGPGLNSSGSGKGQVEGFCKHGDEPRASYNSGNILTL